MKKAIAVVAALLVIVLSALAAERIELENRIHKLTRKFEEMQGKPEKRIPAELLSRAQGIVLLERTKAGFLFAFQGGSGIAMVRDPKSQGWGPAAFVKADEASLGLQIGGQQSFIVMLLMTTNATRLLPEPNVQFGGEARGTAGESSAGTEGTISAQEQSWRIFGDRQGLYVGAALKGNALAPDADANRSYYGETLTVRDILFGQKVKQTGSAAELAKAIHRSANPSLWAGRSSVPAPVASRKRPAVALALKNTPSTSAPPKIVLAASNSVWSPTNAAVQDLELLIVELKKNQQTNAIHYLNGYLSSMLTSQEAADAELTLAVLERLRAYRTAEAIELLESQLDGSLVGLGHSLSAAPKSGRPALPMEILQQAQGYRSQYPRKTGNSSMETNIAHAWGLLNKEN